MPFADEYVLSVHLPLPLHPKVPSLRALDTHSMVLALYYDVIYINTCTYQDQVSYQESEINPKLYTSRVHSQLGR